MSDDDLFSGLLSRDTSLAMSSRSQSARQPSTTGGSLPSTTRRHRSTGQHTARNTPAAKWVLTIWDQEWLRGLPFDQLPEGVLYICGQPERTPETDREHFQGFVIFSNEYRTPEQALAKLGVQSGWAAKSGNQTCKAAIDYTKKVETRITGEDGESLWQELGEVPMNHRKVGEKFDGMVAMIKQGKGQRALCEANPSAFMMYHSGLAKASALLAPNRSRHIKTQVYLIWGATGIGKTHSIFEFLEDEDAIYNKLHPEHDRATDFWEGYDGEEAVLFDDFNPQQYKLVRLLQYFHEYKIMINIKGSARKAAFYRVYITTNVPPNLWYLAEKADPQFEENYSALWRRIPDSHVCRFVERVPDDVTIKTFEDLKLYQDAICQERGLSVRGASMDEQEMRERALRYAKSMNNQQLQRIATEKLVELWQKEKAH